MLRHLHAGEAALKRSRNQLKEGRLALRCEMHTRFCRPMRLTCCKEFLLLQPLAEYAHPAYSWIPTPRKSPVC